MANASNASREKGETTPAKVRTSMPQVKSVNAAKVHLKIRFCTRRVAFEGSSAKISPQTPYVANCKIYGERWFARWVLLPTLITVNRLVNSSPIRIGAQTK